MLSVSELLIAINSFMYDDNDYDDCDGGIKSDDDDDYDVDHNVEHEGVNDDDDDGDDNMIIILILSIISFFLLHSLLLFLGVIIIVINLFVALLFGYYQINDALKVTHSNKVYVYST